MKRTIVFVSIIAFMGMLIIPAIAGAYRPYHHRHYRYHHKPKPVPVAVVAPKPTPRPKGWCKNHPKKCSRTVNTKKEACWDVNKDGFIDDREAAGMRSHPGKCPAN